MRLLVPQALAVLALSCAGCFGHPLDPSEIEARELAEVAGPSRPSRGPTVSCRCDADGGLHVRAPEGSVVRAPEGALGEDAEVEVAFFEEEPAAPIRRSKSLGFIGDNKLGEGPPSDGSWSAPVAGMPYGSYGGGYGYRSFGASGYGGHGGHFSRAPSSGWSGGGAGMRGGHGSGGGGHRAGGGHSKSGGLR